MPDWGKVALYGGITAGAFLLARTAFARDEPIAGVPQVTSGGAPPPIGPWSSAGPTPPIYVGQRGDPELESLLQEMQDFFLSYGGINLNWISAAEVTEMRQTNGYYAIPPRQYWPRMAATLRYGFMPIRTAVGRPITITSGYRPEDYNKVVTCDKEVNGECVVWSEGSRHQWFVALDMIAPQGLANTQAMAAAQMWNRYGETLRMGLGVYGSDGFASNIHIDTGSKRRRWANARYWTNQATA